MKTAQEAMNAILTDAKETLPGLLAKHGAAGFSRYAMGFPVDREEKTQFCARYAGGKAGGGERGFSFDFQAFLPGTLESDAYKCIDAASEYLDAYFDPQLAGCANGSYAVTLADDLRTKTLSVFWSVTLTDPEDDCNEGCG